MNDLNILYYDIECLPQLFSLASYYEPKNETPRCELFYLLDERDWPNGLTDAQSEEIRQEAFLSNPNLRKDAIVTLRDLRHAENAEIIAAMFGSGQDIVSCSRTLTKDTDLSYDEDVHPYLAGYNSLNYDMTMLAFYFSEVFAKGTGSPFLNTTPAELRAYNDELFHPSFKSMMPKRLKYAYNRNGKKGRDSVTIGPKTLDYAGWKNELPYSNVYDYMVSTGRHLDIARLNEKQSFVGLKRILGYMGYQIMEPKTSLNAQAADDGRMTFDTLKNTLAYNVSDVVQLSHVMEHKVYRGPFILKKQMLKDYPGAIYLQKPDKYEPDVFPDKVKPNRLTINASSAKLATAALCPYGQLEDAWSIDFKYPHPDKAKERNISVTDVLEDTKAFIRSRMVPLVKSPAGQDIIKRLETMLAMYGAMVGKDFNSSHDEAGSCFTENIKKYASTVNVPYMGPDGEPTSCFVTFSIGGIHGAEYNKKLYDEDLDCFKEQCATYKAVLEQFPDPLDLVCDVNEKGKPCRRKTITINGTEYKVTDFLATGSSMKKAAYKEAVLHPQPPQLFKANNKGKEQLNKRYTYTSVGEANHEDFESYYPRMLSQMMAFFNAQLGSDPYDEIFQNKKRYGDMMKDDKYGLEEQELYKNMRNGVKLVLNSASGAADMEYDNAIRMNNQITKMRIIGQLFSFRIAQAQALEGAGVPSTNTDGIYTFMEEKKNNEILEREAKAAGVNIEPERLFLISKDTNNRLEVKFKGKTGDLLKDVRILGASGGTLASYDGPNLEKSVDHPAIQDWALLWFLLYKAKNKGRMDEFEPNVGMHLLHDVAPTWEFMKDMPHLSKKKKHLIMFQHILASSPNMHYYNFASKTPITDMTDQRIDPIPCQHYTRIFYVDPDKVPDDKKDRIIYLAKAYMMKKPAKKGNKEEQSDVASLVSVPAVKVIRDFEGDIEGISQPDKIARIQKIKGLSGSQPCMIVNEDLDYTDFDASWLDLTYYNKMLSSCYANGWQNEGEGKGKGAMDMDEENE